MKTLAAKQKKRRIPKSGGTPNETSGQLLPSLIVDSSDDSIITNGLDDKIASWNHGAERMYGYTAEEAVGHKANMLIPPDRQDEEPLILNRLQRGERVEHFETIRRRKNGTLIDVSLTISPINNAAGKLIGVTKISRDITERKHSEEAVQLSSAIVDSSNDAIISKDLNGRIKSWNKSAERLFGYTSEEAIGQPITMLIPTDRLDEEIAILARLRRGERVDHFVTIRRRKDGSLVDISLTVSPVKDLQGKVVGASKIARDITGRKSAEATMSAS